MNKIRCGAVIPAMAGILADKKDFHALNIANAIVDQVCRAGAVRQIHIQQGRAIGGHKFLYLIVHPSPPNDIHSA